MKIIRAKDYADMSRKAANIISAQVIMKPNCVLGLATGGTPVRFPYRIIRGGESPQSVAGKDYTRAKREQHDFSFAECRQSSSHIVMKSCRTVVLESLNL